MAVSLLTLSQAHIPANGRPVLTHPLGDSEHLDFPRANITKGGSNTQVRQAENPQFEAPLLLQPEFVPTAFLIPLLDMRYS